MFSLYEDCQRGVDLTLFCPLQCNDIQYNITNLKSSIKSGIKNSPIVLQKTYL